MRSYYLNPDQRRKGMLGGSAESLDVPITVNCAGCFDTSFSFTTDNPSGRLDFYLMYITEGSLTFTIDEKEEVLGEGTAIIFPPRYHYKYSYNQGEKPLSYLWMHFTGFYAAGLLEELGLLPLARPLSVGSDSHVVRHFQELFGSFSENVTLQRATLAPIAEQILLLIAKAVRREGEPKDVISRSIDYINANFASDICLEMLAKEENLSISRYNTVFKQQFGMPPIRYIIKLRMASACQLLENTDMSVRQVGLLVGYDDPHFFSKLFKKHVGVSPLAYRQKFMIE